jgi:hypothetical protein
VRAINRKTRILLIFFALILCLSSTVLYVSTKPVHSQGQYTLGLPYSPIVGQEVSVAQVQTNMPFKINLPTDLGPIAESKFDNTTKTLTTIFSSTKPADDANFIDILNSNAVVLIQMPSNLTLASARQNILDAVNTTKNDAGGLQLLTINGYLGCEGGNVWHTVTWYTQTTYYQLTANVDYPLQNLVDAANTIPVQ